LKSKSRSRKKSILRKKSIINQIISSLTYKGNLDVELIILIVLMLMFGLIMVASASSVAALYKFNDSMHFLKKQFLFAIIGIVLMLVLSKVDYHILVSSRILVPTLIFTWFFVLITAFVGEELNGARRWVTIAGISIQPSEFAKIGWVLLFASVCSGQKPDDFNKLKSSWVRYGVLIAIIAFPLYLQPHKSAIMLIGMVCVIIALVAGAKIKYLLLAAPVGILGVIAIIFTSEYSVKRMTNFWDPFKDPTGSGWQAMQSLYAIGSGGLFGRGLGKSIQKSLYIPEPQNDFIFSIICEELGFVGAGLVIFLFFLLIVRCIKISMEAPDKLGSLIGIGIASLIFVQVFINIAVVTSLMPVTGMPLPFFSAGGTSLIFTIASMGIVLNISRQGKTNNLAKMEVKG